MVKYQRNNILFRIASSDAISKFKSTQAHAFLQLSRSDIAFDVSAKEVVLLEYDRISQWLYRIERILLSSETHSVSKSLKVAIIESFREEVLTIENVMESHKDVFTKDVNEFTRLIHAYSFSSLTSKMENVLLLNTIERSFTELSNLMTHYLQHLLVCMHEYNNNMITQRCTPFLSLTDSCVYIESESNKLVPLLKRADFFKKKMLAKTYIFKNYSTQIHPFEDACKELSALAINLVKESE